MVRQWEDFSIDLATNDIYFDSLGDISANYLNVTDNERDTQLKIDIYHQIKNNEVVIRSLESNPEKAAYIKSLFINDFRILDFDILIQENDISIENIQLRS